MVAARLLVCKFHLKPPRNLRQELQSAWLGSAVNVHEKFQGSKRPTHTSLWEDYEKHKPVSAARLI